MNAVVLGILLSFIVGTYMLVSDAQAQQRYGPPIGDSVRARNSIRNGYRSDKYKVTMGYIENDTVSQQELIDNELIGLRVLPDYKNVVIDSFDFIFARQNSDCALCKPVHGNRLISCPGNAWNLWWAPNTTLKIDNIFAHRVSDGKVLRLCGLKLFIRQN